MDARTLCLGALNGWDLSGYDIRKMFEEGPFRHIQDVSFGSIYPALRRLTDDGLVREAEPDGDGDSRPDRKVYSITQAGREALKDAVNRDPAPDKFRSDMLFCLYFAQMVDPDQLDRLLLNRLVEARTTLEHIESCGCQEEDPGRAFVIGLGVAVNRAEIAYLEAHRQALVDTLRQAHSAPRSRPVPDSDAAD